MAMLAEPRRKQKWTLNPRGKQWSDDSNKFGQKMLEKMGWTSGKGLGAKEQGMTEHVRVRFKDDQAGIGFSKSHQDKLWTEQQENYNDLLQSLQETSNSSKIDNSIDLEKNKCGESLELKSKRSRARVHYKKFTRGKDVNKYSTKDLANIFGKKDLNECSKTVTKVSCTESIESESNNTNSIGSADTTGGVLTIKGGTIKDYFKDKIPITSKRVVFENKLPVEPESDDERHVGFGFSQEKLDVPEKNVQLKENLENTLANNSTSDVNTSVNTHRKRKAKLFFESSSLNNENINANETPKKRKTVEKFAFENNGLDLTWPLQSENIAKNNMELSISNEENKVRLCQVGDIKQKDMIGHENNALDLTDEVTGKKCVTFNDTIEYNTDLENRNKKKDKKKKRSKNKAHNKLDKFEVELDEITKKKLKNMCSIATEENGFVNEALDVEIINEESVDNETNERKCKKIKRKKKMRPVINLDPIEEEEDAVQVDNNKSDVIILSENPPSELNQVTKQNVKSNVKKNIVELTTVNDVIEINEGIEDDSLSSVNDKKKREKKKAKKEMSHKKKIKIENEISIVDLQDDSELVNRRMKKKRNNDDREECEVINEVSNCIEVDERINDDMSSANDYSIKNNIEDKYKIKKSKRVLKSLFIQRPFVNFIGSNVNELRGYGVE